MPRTRKAEWMFLLANASALRTRIALELARATVDRRAALYASAAIEADAARLKRNLFKLTTHSCP